MKYSAVNRIYRCEKCGKQKYFNFRTNRMVHFDGKSKCK
jgi:hypothetical protein